MRPGLEGETLPHLALPCLKGLVIDVLITDDYGNNEGSNDTNKTSLSPHPGFHPPVGEAEPNGKRGVRCGRGGPAL